MIIPHKQYNLALYNTINKTNLTLIYPESYLFRICPNVQKLLTFPSIITCTYNLKCYFLQTFLKFNLIKIGEN